MKKIILLFLVSIIIFLFSKDGITKTPKNNFFDIGVEHYLNGKLESAVKNWRKAHSKDKSNIRKKHLLRNGLIILGKYALKDEDYSSATKYFKKANKLAPNSETMQLISLSEMEEKFHTGKDLIPAEELNTEEEEENITKLIFMHEEKTAAKDEEKGSGTIIVQKRLTKINLKEINVISGESFWTCAELIDELNAKKITNKKLIFEFGKSTKKVKTNKSGKAKVRFLARENPGTYEYIVKFNEDKTFASIQNKAKILIMKRNAVIEVRDIKVRAKEKFIVTAILKDVNNKKKLSGKELTFSFNDSSDTGITDNNGIAKVEFRAPAKIGCHKYSVDFTGDLKYNPTQNDTGKIHILKRENLLVSEDIKVSCKVTFVVKVTLLDADTQSPSTDKKIKFLFNGIKKESDTDIRGTAEVTFLSPPKIGLFLCRVTFPEDELYNSSSSKVQIITMRRSVIIKKKNVSTIANESFTLKASVKDKQTKKPIPNRHITFMFNKLIKKATTDKKGIARATYIAPSASGSYGYEVAFAGDAIYAPAGEGLNIYKVKYGDRLCLIARKFYGHDSYWPLIMAANPHIENQYHLIPEIEIIIP